MGFLSLGYRRPARVDQHRQSLDSTDESLRSGSSGASAGIPAALTFDKILDGGTCPVSRSHQETHQGTRDF